MNTLIKRILLIAAFVVVAACIVPAWKMGKTKGHQEGMAAAEQIFDSLRYQAYGDAVMNIANTNLVPNYNDAQSLMNRGKLLRDGGSRYLDQSAIDSLTAQVDKIAKAYPEAASKYLENVAQVSEIQKEARQAVIENLRKQFGLTAPAQ